MASFVMKQMVGGKINEMKGGIDKLTGDEKKEGEGGEKTETGEDPEVVAARLEQEERRKEKHRKMEQEREKMRTDIRNKYNIKKKEADDNPFQIDSEGRIGAAKHKTPEELAKEGEEDDSLMGQLGLSSAVESAKTSIGGVMDKVKSFLPFGN